MIYLDTSVALAQLFAEDRQPPAALWQQPLVSSRLLEYELWTRVNARGLAETYDEHIRGLLGRVAFLELARPVLERALESFPLAVRTLDALHLASMDFLRRQGQQVMLASYDDRLVGVAQRMKLGIFEL
jgi:predicted nucleic acid-binding protein